MKVKELITLLQTFDGDLEVYLQELETRHPAPRRYSVASLAGCFIAVQNDNGTRYLAIGDVVTKDTIGYDADGKIIKYSEQ